MARRQVIVGALLLACLAGCGRSTPTSPAPSPSASAPPSAAQTGVAVQIAPLPSDIRPLTLQGPPTDSGFYDVNHWPAACDLLSDDDLRGIFPQVKAVARTPGPQSFPQLGGSSPTTASVPNAECRIALELPNTAFHPDGIDGSGFVISIRVDAAGSEEVITLNKPKVTVTDGPGAQHAFELGPSSCIAPVQPLFQCATKHVKFTMALSTAEFDATKDPEALMRYQKPGAEVAVFRRDATGPDDVRRKWDYERTMVLSELANLAAVKASG